MPRKIENTIDNLRTTLASTLSSRVELPNPYNLDSEGSYLDYKNGWGLVVGAGTPTQIDDKSVSTLYSIEIVLTEEWQGVNTAATTTAVAKSLHSDAVDVQLALEHNTLSGNVVDLSFQGLSPLVVNGDDRVRWGELRLTYTAIIREVIT